MRYRGEIRHQEREGRIGDRRRDGGEDGNKNEDRNGQESRDGGKNGSGNVNENKESVNRWLEDMRERVTPTSDQRPQSQDPTPQRDRCIMRRTRAQRRKVRDRIGESGGGAKKRKKPQKSHRRNEENGRDSGGRRKDIDKRGLVQYRMSRE